MSKNLGLYTIIILTVLGLIPWFMFNNTLNILIEKRINSVIFYDCLNFDEKKISKKEFFLRTNFEKNLQPKDVNKELDSISGQKVIINQNFIYNEKQSKKFNKF